MSTRGIGDQNPAQSIKSREDVRLSISLRVREVREALYGEFGLPEIAAAVGVPDKAWQDYETGDAIPAEVLLCLIEVTGVTPHWLLTGRGDKYRSGRWILMPHTRN